MSYFNLDGVDALGGKGWPDDKRLVRLHKRTNAFREKRLSFFYHLVRERKPALCLEIGCHDAFVSAYMCAAASDYGGQVIAIDIGDRHTPKHVLPDLFDNFHYLLGDSRRKGNRVQAFVDQYGPIGVVWQDSSHLYGQSCEEWDIYRPMLSEEKRAVWVCDDLTLHYPEDEGTPTIWGYWLERPGREKKIYWPPSIVHESTVVGVIIL